MIVDTPFLISGRHAPELLEAVDQAFHLIPQPIDRSVKRSTTLVLLVRDRHPDAASPQILANLPAAVPLVAHHAPWSQARSSAAHPLDRPLLHQVLKGARLVALAWREHKRQRLAVAFGPHMHLGAEPTLTPSQRFVVGVTSRCARRVLMRANDGPIDVVDLPIEPASGICLLLQGVQDALPEALLAPAIEAAGEGGPGTVPHGDIAPGSTGPIEPQETVDHATMVDVGFASLAAFGRPLGWEERLQSLPLSISQVMSTHALKFTGFAYRR